VKVSSPVKQFVSVVAEQVCSSEGSTGSVEQMPTRRALWHEALKRLDGTTGVQVHGMYLKLLSEPGRSPLQAVVRKGARHIGEQGLKAKFGAMEEREVRCHRSSWEVG
jgi:hypothetical protein